MKIVDWRGVRRLMAAKLIKDDAETIEYDTPFQLCGVSKLSRSTETSKSSKYYDNVPAVVISGEGTDTVAIDGSAIGDEERAKINGEYYDAETGLYIEGEGEESQYALGYVTKKTDGTEILVWRLKGTFSNPSDEHNTEDDGTDSTGNSIEYTGIPTAHKFEVDGKPARAVRIPLNKFKPGEDAFFAQVQTPDTIKAAANTAAE